MLPSARWSALIKQYEADMAEVLPKVTPETMEIARELAELPLTIRGFGPVKAQAEQMAAKRRENFLPLSAQAVLRRKWPPVRAVI